MNWKDQAVCFDDKNSSYWTSYDFDKVQYAKNGCSRCPVKMQCMMAHADDPYAAGVIGGLSEFDRLLILNKEKSE